MFPVLQNGAFNVHYDKTVVEESEIWINADELVAVSQSTLDQIDWMLQQCLFIREGQGSEGQAMVFIYFWNQRGKPWYFYISETRGTSHGQIDWMLQQCLFIRWREREERTCKKRPWATFTRHCSCLSAQSWKSKKMIQQKFKKVRLWKCRCHVSKAMFQKY